MKLLTAHYLDNGPYRLYDTEVPDELFRGASLNIIEFLNHGSLKDTVGLLISMLQKNDGYHLATLERYGEDHYMLVILWGTQHITDYILANQPVCVGTPEEVSSYLAGLPHQDIPVSDELPF